ncbi:MAG TPA: sulfite exporter TauE/SafE family protein [Burkholderiales bacterium]|nr:sulfite exporter TauE/SafE family protein [Burkholderiales bacterium]
MTGFATLSLEIVLWASLVIALAGFVQGALGLGFPTVATPLIAVTTDMRTAVILVLLPCLAAVTANVVKSGSFRQALAEFWMMPIYMLIGAAIGTRLFIFAPQFPFSLLLAAMILLYLNLDRVGRADWAVLKRHRTFFAAVFGVAAGMSEGTANVAAPPLLVYYLALGLTPAVLVQALNICFLVGKSTQFATLATVGGVEASQWIATLPLVVVASVTVLYGMRVRARLNAAAYRLWLKRALFVVALFLLLQYAYGLLGSSLA